MLTQAYFFFLNVNDGKVDFFISHLCHIILQKSIEYADLKKKNTPFDSVIASLLIAGSVNLNKYE